MNLTTQVQFIKGIGPKLGKKLEKLGIQTVKDFIYYFPRAYDDRRQIPNLNQHIVGDSIQAIGQVVEIEEKKVHAKLSLLKATIYDGTSQLGVQWFNQSFLKKVIKKGKWLYLKGKIEFNHFDGRRVLTASEHEIFASKLELNKEIGVIIPLYSLTAGVYQYQLRNLAKSIFKENKILVKDPLPEKMKIKMQLLDLNESLLELHFPTNRENYLKARTRLVFDEFFYYQLRLCQSRHSFKKQSIASPLNTEGHLVTQYIELLPYELTDAQKRVQLEIFKDLEKNVCMNRLVQGDVGSGKTDLAILTLLCAIQSSKKAALMAPTEILVEQHYLKMKTLLSTLSVPIYLLKSKLKAKEKRVIVDALQADEPAIVIGTHALIQNYVSIQNLGCIVIDEQHRFGVIQRLTLKNKGSNPHALFLTATPIPRSFMLTCFGDLDKSILDELPPGRKVPKTYFLYEHDVEKAYKHCQQKLSSGQQLYIVYPLVEESEKLDLKSAVEGFEFLTQRFNSYRVGLIHGKMSPLEKGSVMQSFKANEIQILVATTVIEVGIDVPNATMMIIQHAERFGLSQLHQLRGRIGRGGHESDCFLIANPKSESGKARIKAMVDTSDGFKLSEIDLKIRGPGDMLGTKQSGLPNFNLANLVKDEKILLIAKQVADSIISNDPNLNSFEYRFIKQELEQSKSELLEVQLN